MFGEIDEKLSFLAVRLSPTVRRSRGPGLRNAISHWSSVCRGPGSATTRRACSLRQSCSIAKALPPTEPENLTQKRYMQVWGQLLTVHPYFRETISWTTRTMPGIMEAFRPMQVATNSRSTCIQRFISARAALLSLGKHFMRLELRGWLPTQGPVTVSTELIDRSCQTRCQSPGCWWSWFAFC